MKSVLALIGEDDDSYDVGSHDVVLQLFADRELAERVAAELVGKVRNPGCYASNSCWGGVYGLSVEEMIVQ